MSRGRGRAKSLRGRLITRLLVLQALTLFGLSLFLLLLIGGSIGSGTDMPDPKDAEIVAQSVTRQPDGTLTITPTPALQDIIDTTPGFWFVAVTPDGTRLTHGDIPPAFTIRSIDADRFVSSLVLDASGREYDVILRLIGTPHGALHVMVGNGRRVGILSFLLLSAGRTALPSIAVLAIMTLIAIPWLIRREFRGVAAAVVQAGQIDPGKRGVRLPLDDVPSEIAPLVGAVNDALARLDAGDLRQKRFLADAAHELKTPIAVLHTRIETSLAGPERARLLLDVTRLGMLAEQLLDMQRIERDQSAMLQDLDMVEIGQTVAADLAPLAIEAGYDLSFDSEVARWPIRGNRVALERAVTNLVQNAIMHGGGTGMIRIHIDRDGALEVSDEGPGLAPEHQRAVFEPFYRVHPLDHGSGLGLSLVEEVIHAHGGHVSAGQIPGGGARFGIRLPGARTRNQTRN